MTPRRVIRDLPASLWQRLRNLAHRRGLAVNPLLEQYACERLLYRLSVSEEKDRFTLKGAALFRVWDQEDLRPTRDIDFLADGSGDPASIRKSLEAVCAVPCPADGVVFDPATIRTQKIRRGQPNGGVRVRLEGRLGRIRLHFRSDVGFGDVVTPEREMRTYPTLLDLPAPHVWAYPRETVVAEKLEALLSLGPTNSRVKDVWDIACLARRLPFDGATLQSAIEATLRRRGTALSRDSLLALRAAWYEDPERQALWQCFRRRIGVDTGDGPEHLADAGKELRRFLGPVCDSLTDGSPFIRDWPRGGPWQARIPG